MVSWIRCRMIDRLRAYLVDHPDSNFAWFRLAMELQAMDRGDEAVECLRRVILDAPELTAAYAHAGSILKDKGRTSEAEYFLSRGIETARRLGQAEARVRMERTLTSLRSCPPAWE